MSNKVFKIKFNKSSYDLNEQYEKLSDIEKGKISEMDAVSFFDYQDHMDKYVCFIITTPLEINKYLDILSSNFIQFESNDISLDILKFNINLEEELRPLLSTTNSIKYGFFIDDISDWILENLEIDMVLDRISDVGIDNLTKIEKDFLENFKI